MGTAHGLLRSTVWWLLGATYICALVESATAAEVKGYKYVGAQTCGQSTCHAADMPWLNSAVRQNEYRVWSTRDRHSEAYNSLQTERAHAIAGKLGLGDPTGENLCLDCHANNVKPELRGRNFEITEGVTCETCHGAAERWLSTHLSGTTFPGDNYKAGMYPTADPLARAELCMACHVGNTKNISHRLLGAGHPRTPFELDTYSVSQPAHFRIDADYAVRKEVSNEATIWATGQVLQASKMLKRMSRLSAKPAYAFTEFSLFDCYACHHVRDQSKASLKYGGIPPFNDAHYAMAGIIAERLDPSLGVSIEEQIDKLHLASAEGWDATHMGAKALEHSIDALAKRVAEKRLDHRDAASLMASILQAVESGRFNSYLMIEQSVLAVSTLIDAQRSAGALSETQYDNMRRELDRCYSATENDEEFALDVIKSAFSNMRKILPAF